MAPEGPGGGGERGRGRLQIARWDSGNQRCAGGMDGGARNARPTDEGGWLPRNETTRMVILSARSLPPESMHKACTSSYENIGELLASNSSMHTVGTILVDTSRSSSRKIFYSINTHIIPTKYIHDMDCSHVHTCRPRRQHGGKKAILLLSPPPNISFILPSPTLFASSFSPGRASALPRTAKAGRVGGRPWPPPPSPSSPPPPPSPSSSFPRAGHHLGQHLPPKLLQLPPGPAIVLGQVPAGQGEAVPHPEETSANERAVLVRSFPDGHVRGWIGRVP